MKVSDAWPNLVPRTWTADGEGAFPELGPVLNRSCMVPDSAVLNLMLLLRYTVPR